MRTIYLLFAFSLFFIACNDQNGLPLVGSTKPQSIGLANDLLVVTDTTLAKTPFGQTFKKHFDQPYGVLPQPEAFFKLTKVPAHSLNGLLRKTKNIFFIADLDERNTTTNFVKENLFAHPSMKKLEVTPDYYYFQITDLWAKPQIVTVLIGRGQTNLIEGFNQDKDHLIHQLNEFENKILAKKIKDAPTMPFVKDIEKQFGVNIHIPDAYRKGNMDSDFSWYMKDVKDGYSNIVIYERAYEDTSDFNIRNILANRDTVLGKYIFGETEGSKMVTEFAIAPQIRTAKIAGTYAKETRGLWKLSKDFMGGPFIRYTLHHPTKKNLLVLEGFVTAPSTGKKKYIKELEAIFSTLKWTKNAK